MQALSKFQLSNSDFCVLHFMYQIYRCTLFTWWLALHVYLALGLAAWWSVWISLPGRSLAVMMSRWIPGVVGRVIPSRPGLTTPSWRWRTSWGVMAHRRVFGMPLRWPRGSRLIWVTRGRVPTSGAMVPVVTWWWMPPAMAVLILRPQVLLRRFIIIMIGVLNTMPTSSRVAAAIVSRTGARFLKPVSFFLAQMVGFGNREQITINLHVVWRERHAGCKKEEGRRKTNRMQKKRKKDR